MPYLFSITSNVNWGIILSLYVTGLNVFIIIIEVKEHENKDRYFIFYK